MNRQTGVVSETSLTGAFGVDIARTFCVTDTEDGEQGNTHTYIYKSREHLSQVICLHIQTPATKSLLPCSGRRRSDERE